MKKMKKLLALFLVMLLLASNTYVSFAQDDKNVAEILLNGNNATFSSSFVEGVRMGLLPAVTLTSRQGVKCWQLKSVNRNNGFVCVNLSDGFAKEISDGSCFEISVDYYDDTAGLFCLEYDSQLNPDRETEAVYLEGSQSWKTHTFYVDDAFFGTRHWNNQGDFSIAVRSDKYAYSAGNVCISKITVKKLNQKKPVQCMSVKTEEIGNIFGNGEEKKFTVDFKNFSDITQNAEVVYTAYDDFKNKAWTKTENIEIPAGETLTKTVTPEVTRYCLYDFEVQVKCGDAIQSFTRPFSFINTIEDGTKNDYVGYCTKYTLPGYDAFDSLEVVDKSGAGFVRNSLQWQIVDPVGVEKGGFALTPEAKVMFEAMKKYGIKWQWLVGMGNTKYNMKGTNTIPTTEEQLSAFEKYLDFIFEEIENYDIDVHSYEIWNEPNLVSFNNLMADGKTYGEFALRMLEHIRKYDDVTTSTMFSVTGLTLQSCKKYFEDALAVIPEGYLDAFTIHPYNHNALPEQGQSLVIPEYKEMVKNKMGKEPKIYNTELGYYSGAGHAADPRVQAEYNMRTYVYYKAKGHGDYFSWYNISNEGGVKTYSEDNFGHLLSHKEAYDVPLAAKEVFVADTALNKILQNADAVETVFENETDYAYTFLRPKDNKKIITLWTAGAPKVVTLKLDADKAILYDIYGNPVNMQSHDGTFDVMLTNSMQYLEADFESAKCIEEGVKLSETNLEVAQHSNISLNVEGLSEGAHVKANLSSGGTAEVNENGTISLKCTNAVGSTDSLNITVEENGSASSFFKVPLKITEPFTADISADILGKDDVTRWNGKILITNNNPTAPLDAKITFEAPKFLADNYGTMKISTIPAFCTGEFEFKMPKINDHGIYDVVYTIETKDGIKKTFEQTVDFTCAIYTDKVPVIDGKMSEGEWDERATMSFNSANQVSMLGTNVWNGPSDLSGAANIMFDEENLYVYVKVNDDIKAGSSVNELIWQNDGVQFGISFDKRLHDVMVGGTFTEISYSDAPNGPTVWRHSAEGNNLPVGRVDNSKLAVTRQGMVTHYELEIPWSEITVQDIDFDALDKIGFAMVVNDDDGNTRKGWIEYAGGIARQKDTSQFTYLCIAR